MLDALNPITAGMRRSLAALGTLLLLAVAAPGASAIDTPAQGPDATDPNPLLGQTWWTMDPKWDPRWIDYHRLMSQGRTGDAALVRKLAEQPQFRWWGRWEGVSSPERKLHATFAVLDEQAPGAVPLLVSMRHLGQRCSPNYLAGGAREDALYRRWIDGFARAIGDRRVVIAFEPDSMGTVECLAKRRRKARYQTLAYGIDVLSKLPNATVYVDAGAADWQGVPLMARKLRRVGIHKVRGFMLNATHQAWTAGNIEYGRRLSRALGGKHFIINTSHNGNGPMHRKVWISRKRNLWRIETEWCNPPNAAAGVPPTTSTADPLVDAYMWVERPGYSNGACNGGPARVGAWWRDRALQMARLAKW